MEQNSTMISGVGNSNFSKSYYLILKLIKYRYITNPRVVITSSMYYRNKIDEMATGNPVHYNKMRLAGNLNKPFL